MRFVRWYPLAQASGHAPEGPGVYQIRVSHRLIDYPRGKSAMVHYGAAGNVRQAVARLAAQAPEPELLCRHAVELSPGELSNPSLALQPLLDQFRRRFGAEPGFHEGSLGLAANNQAARADLISFTAVEASERVMSGRAKSTVCTACWL